MTGRLPSRQRVGRGIKSALWNPIIAKEVHSRMRNARALILLIGFVAIMAAIGYVSYRNLDPETSRVTALTSSGTKVFVPLAWAALAMLSLFVPGLLGGAIAGERERQTLDLLLCTPMRPGRIIMGKLVASLLFILFLVVASLPIFSIVFILGGIPFVLVFQVFVILVATVFMFGSFGIMCSVLLKRSAQATLSAFVLATLAYLGPLLFSNLLHSSYYSYGIGSSAPPVLSDLSPYVAMQYTLDASTQVQDTLSTCAPGVSSASELCSPPTTNPSINAAFGNVLMAGGVSVICLFISVAVLRGPSRPFRSRPLLAQELSFGGPVRAPVMLYCVQCWWSTPAGKLTHCQRCRQPLRVPPPGFSTSDGVAEPVTAAVPMQAQGALGPPQGLS